MKSIIKKASFIPFALILAAVPTYLSLHSASATGTLYSSNNGSVTPSLLRITFTSLNLIKADNGQLTLLEGEYPTDFKRDGGDLAATKLDNINVPAGRYIGVSLGLHFSYAVELDGVVYQGVTANGITAGTTRLCTTNAGGTVTSARSGGSIKTCNAGDKGDLMSGMVAVGGPNAQEIGAAASYFGKVVCVASDSSQCQSDDQFVDIASATSPDLYIMMDLYNSVAVDTANLAIAINNTYPVPMIGKPGAAIHLSDATTGAEWMAIFGDSQTLLATRGFGSAPIGSGQPTGGDYLTVTGTPSGVYFNQYGPTTMHSFDPATGMVKSPIFNKTGGSSNNTSSGIMELPALTKTAVGGTITATCKPDASETPPYLGYTYTPHGDCTQVPGGTSMSVAYKVVRIVDPGNMFGMCPTTDSHFIAGSNLNGGTGGTCAAVTPSGNNNVGGYP